MEGLSGVADHYCAICAIQIILEFPDQIWMNQEDEGEQSFLANHSRAAWAGVKSSLSVTPQTSLARRCKTTCFVMRVVLVTKRNDKPA